MASQEALEFCEVRSCDTGEGAAKAKYYCKTEGKLTCEQDNEFCHRMAHNWKELGTDYEENATEGGKA